LLCWSASPKYKAVEIDFLGRYVSSSSLYFSCMMFVSSPLMFVWVDFCCRCFSFELAFHYFPKPRSLSRSFCVCVCFPINDCPVTSLHPFALHIARHVGCWSTRGIFVWKPQVLVDQFDCWIASWVSYQKLVVTDSTVRQAP